MQIKTRVFRGLTFDILVEEAQATDTNGGRLWYLAAIYVQERGSQDRTLIRRTRLPGAAEELAAAIRRDGIRVFDRFRPIQTDAATQAVQPTPATRPGQPQQHRRGGAPHPRGL